MVNALSRKNLSEAVLIDKSYNLHKPCHVNSRLCLVHFDKHTLGLQALYINPGCLKCISGMNLSLANKNLITISFI